MRMERLLRIPLIQNKRLQVDRSPSASIMLAETIAHVEVKHGVTGRHPYAHSSHKVKHGVMKRHCSHECCKTHHQRHIAHAFIDQLHPLLRTLSTSGVSVPFQKFYIMSTESAHTMDSSFLPLLAATATAAGIFGFLTQQPRGHPEPITDGGGFIEDAYDTAAKGVKRAQSATTGFFSSMFANKDDYKKRAQQQYDRMRLRAQQGRRELDGVLQRIKERTA